MEVLESTKHKVGEAKFIVGVKFAMANIKGMLPSKQVAYIYPSPKRYSCTILRVFQLCLMLPFKELWIRESGDVSLGRFLGSLCRDYWAVAPFW